MQMFPSGRLIIGLLLVMTSLVAQAVTLGEARVNSYLNQPFDAEIELIGMERGQHADLRLRVANQDYFERLGIAYTPTLADLSFEVVQIGNRWIVRARSSRPVTEPFIEFPLQMRWPGGQMIRQYTLLLDPLQPVRRSTAAQTTAAERPSTAPTAPAAVTNRDTRPSLANRYGPVQRGETLWPIAQKLKPSGITTRQMAMALLRANPQAFINGDINRLRAGAVLQIPARAFVEELSAEQARRQFTEATQRRQPAVATSPRTTPDVTARPTPDTEASTPAPEAPVTPPPEEETTGVAQLRIIGEPKAPEDQTGGDEGLEEKLLVTMEEIESNRLTTDAIETRLSRLEQELERMQALVALKDAQIAALQTEAQTGDAIDTAAALAEPTPPPSTTGATGNPVQSTPSAPVVVETVTAAAPQADSATAILQDRQLWLVWAALALVGLAVLLLMLRRQRGQTEDETADVELATVAPVAAAPVFASPPPAPPRQQQRGIEEDLRAVADARLPDDTMDTDTVELPELDLSQLQSPGDAQGTDSQDISESVLAEMLEETRLANETQPAKRTEAADFDDDDIASWIRELDGHEGTNADRLTETDEIPSILSELDSQMAGTGASEFAAPTQIELEPVADPMRQDKDDTEDDAFRMSLDLARAYLEIGDQEGARDMLQQALSGARNPEHRRQIEELLQQIG
jgi:FimV-like protein